MIPLDRLTMDIFRIIYSASAFWVLIIELAAQARKPCFGTLRSAAVRAGEISAETRTQRKQRKKKSRQEIRRL